MPLNRVVLLNKAAPNTPQWPPHNFRPDVTDPAHSPASQPQKKKPTTRPLTTPFSKTHSTAPKPTGSPTSSKHPKAKGPSFPVSRPSKAAHKSPPRRTKAHAAAKPPHLRLISDRFPNPAPSYILKFDAVMEAANDVDYSAMNHVGAGGGAAAGIVGAYVPEADRDHLAAAVTAAASAHADEDLYGAHYGPFKRIKGTVSPIRTRPIQEPMPTVNFDSSFAPKVTFEEALRHYSSFLSFTDEIPSKITKSAPAKPLSSRGVKTVSPPSTKGHRHARGELKVKLPEMPVVEPKLLVDMSNMKVVEKTTTEVKSRHVEATTQVKGQHSAFRSKGSAFNHTRPLIHPSITLPVPRYQQQSHFRIV